MFEKNKIVVTGGAGFIGSHIAEELLNRGAQVLIIDDLSTGKLNNIKPLMGDNLEFFQASITDLPLLQKVFSKVDYVFHEAAIASVISSIDHPLASHEVNLTGTLNVLLAARDNQIKKVVCASSCAIYGNDPSLPKSEDMTPLPQSSYAVTKLANEYYCRVFNQIYGLPTVCLRYFNVYGPRQTPNSQYAAVIPTFIQRTMEGKSPIIYGDGEQSRDFVFVKDVVNANLLAANNDVTGIYNIGTGEHVSLNALAAAIVKVIGNNVEPVHTNPQPGDIRHSLANISKARSFGYEPKVDLQEGLTETIKSLSLGSKWDEANESGPAFENRFASNIKVGN